MYSIFIILIGGKMEAQSTLIASIDKFLTTGTEILFSNIVFYVFIVVAILFTILLKG